MLRSSRWRYVLILILIAGAMAYYLVFSLTALFVVSTSVLDPTRAVYKPAIAAIPDGAKTDSAIAMPLFTALLPINSIKTESSINSLKNPIPELSLSRKREKGPSICIVARSSPSHIPHSLFAFSFSLSSAPYENIIQFIIGCEFSREDENRLRVAVRAIHAISGETKVFIVKKNPAKSAHYRPTNMTDYCYIETDLIMDKLINAKWGDLTSGELSWPALRDESHTINENDRLCDYFLFTNTDNVYGRAMFPELINYTRAEYVSTLISEYFFFFFVVCSFSSSFSLPLAAQPPFLYFSNHSDRR
jgi:hypothetical protein